MTVRGWRAGEEEEELDDGPGVKGGEEEELDDGEEMLGDMVELDDVGPSPNSE
jgi:hypothetical protein